MRGERLLWLCGAALWGLAEATLFFVVPDVLLMVLTVRHGTRVGAWAALLAAFGAAAGGGIMWLAGASAPAPTLSLVGALPAISDAMIAHVGGEMHGASWPLHLALGSFTGVPYKIYAAQAGVVGISPALLLLASIPARLPRFLLSVGLAELIRIGLARLGRERLAGRVIAIFWLLFYAAYWSLMPG